MKPVCSNNGADHGVNQSMYNSFNVDQASPKGAQDDSGSTAKAISSQGVSVGMSTPNIRWEYQPISAAKVVSAPGREGKCSVAVAGNSAVCTNVSLDKGNTNNENDNKGELCPIYDINYAGVADKFVNSILHANQFNLSENTDKVNTEIYNAWRRQSDFKFGFVPIDEQLSDIEHTSNVMGRSPFTIQEFVKSTNKPNLCKQDSQLIHSSMLRHGRSI